MQKKDRLALMAAFLIAAFPLVYVLFALMIALRPAPPLVLESNNSCRPEGTAEYSNDAYSQLKDILAYDGGPGELDHYVMKAKVERLVRETEYHALKALIGACAPRFRDSSYVGDDPSKRGVLSGTLRRSRIDIDDERELKQFSTVHVSLKPTE